MNKFYTTLLSIAFSATAMAQYTEPTFTADNNKPFSDSKFKDTYVESIELTNGDITKNWEYSEPRTFWNVLSDMTMDAKGGETITAHFVAHSLGEYSEGTVKQDLRFTAVVLAIDWDGDGSFEFAQKIVGNTPPTNNVGGNMDVLDFQYDIKVPEDVKTGTARVRFNYTNAWLQKVNEQEESIEQYTQRAINTCKEGIVYDFDINVTPKVVQNFAITITPNENADIVVKNGDTPINSGDEVAEGTKLSVEVTPHENFKLVSIMAGETDITEAKEFTVQEATTISVTVKEVVYSTVSYTIDGDETNIKSVELYDDAGDEINNNTKLEDGSNYYVYIYPKDETVEITATLNGENIDLVYEEDLSVYYYEGVVEGNQTIVIKVPGEGTGVESVEVASVYYNSAEQVLYANGKVTVYDMTGRVVLVNEGNTSVAHLTDGIYTAVVNGKAVKFNK